VFVSVQLHPLTTVVETMLIARITFGLACLGMLMPQGLMAATPRPTTPVPTSDVVLGEGGMLFGRLIDGRGYGLPGRRVDIHRGGKLIVWMRTDQFGRFAVKNLPGGPYAVTSGSSHYVVRAWAAGSAPPRTSTRVVLVEHAVAVRKQAPAIEPISSSGPSLGLGPLGLSAVIGMAIAIPVLVSAQQDDGGSQSVGGAGAPASP